MITFLIQKIDGKIVHDFSFTLERSIEYTNWWHEKNVETSHYGIAYCELDDLSVNLVNANTIPCGTVEFVLRYASFQLGAGNILPLNIPSELAVYEYSKRVVRSRLFENSWVNDENAFLYVKDASRIKGYSACVLPGNTVLPGVYQTTERVDIVSEYRCFIYKGDLVGIQCYSGDFTEFPDVLQIKKMVRAYADAPDAYTLDVGVGPRGTFVIECHDLFSCGLYGFSDEFLYPKMLVAGYRGLQKKWVRSIPIFHVCE